ncbi:uncharacterized protein METZ01_LOCUS24988, partial [marine metagenome]
MKIIIKVLEFFIHFKLFIALGRAIIIDFILFVHPKDSILFFLLPVCII